MSLDVNSRHSPGLATISGLQATGGSIGKDEGITEGLVDRVKNDLGGEVLCIKLEPSVKCGCVLYLTVCRH